LDNNKTVTFKYPPTKKEGKEGRKEEKKEGRKREGKGRSGNKEGTEFSI
jgi:hypothetical protein